MTRPVRIAPLETTVRRGPEGTVYLKSPRPLEPYGVRLTGRLEHWAREAPNRTFLAQRGEGGAWRTVTYAEALSRVRRIGQALLDRRLSHDRPLLIVSGNSIEHGLMALAAMYTGVLYAPVAPAYSLQTRDFLALRRIVALIEPALVFAAEGATYEQAIRAVLPDEVELVVSSSAPASRPFTPFAALEAGDASADVDDAHARVGPETIAKVLFTSGSTGQPKGVINTQRMLCANQEMMRSALPFLEDEPPVLVDWSPWNHTAGGNHNFGLVLHHGGTLYIDDGKPTPALFEATVRNLRDVACTAHFAVPRLYEMLMPWLRRDPVLRERFFSRLKLLFFAAAGLGQQFWDELRELSIEACGEEILIMSGFGCTETAPFALSTGSAGAFAGFIGLPAPGLELKLVRTGEKMEARARGPNVTPGYWRDEALTRSAFDEEGFYRLGDAMQFADPLDPARGLLFDGRLAEDFKLSTGTWVSVGPLRSRILARSGGYAQDVVIAGPDRPFVTALIVPSMTACRALLAASAIDPAEWPARDVLDHPLVRRRFQETLDELARVSTGTSTFVARAVLLDEPPSIEAREVTDKGSLNQQAVLRHRRTTVDALYAATTSPSVLSAATER